MTGMLASVNSLEEARLVLSKNVDIIDLKDPASGALGALSTGRVAEIVKMVNGACPVSATIGDLPMHPDLIFEATSMMLDTGVDFVKIGFFPCETEGSVVEMLTLLGAQTNLIAVLFAETQPDISLINSLIKAGFRGIMLDTMDKSRGSLTDIMTGQDIAQFVNHVKSNGLLCGLAGSLTLEDIPELLLHQPDYLGFRGALCAKHNRTGQLKAQLVQEIKQAIAKFNR
jgi:uncharacterized protein (UPF0264 family)